MNEEGGRPSSEVQAMSKPSWDQEDDNLCNDPFVEVAALRFHVDELEHIFELQHERVCAAEKMWQAATGNADTHPDLGELVKWLMERIAELEQERDERDRMLGLKSDAINRLCEQVASLQQRNRQLREALSEIKKEAYYGDRDYSFKVIIYACDEALSTPAPSQEHARRKEPK